MQSAAGVVATARQDRPNTGPATNAIIATPTVIRMPHWQSATALPPYNTGPRPSRRTGSGA
ncbi:hypothetical protein [Kibdelosporangium phytohabitans]|uniref:Uncharacterized protein n=1 Tax=Kibdelosporangium phytohabitans TaxID=860235 RepID=A0A0N7F586_9PSEU|nr:hypothetical protein [Kibdelosporangium phytohabitans]ALG13535.1 hypothetical protein AOZ06_47710 [Kibdelosporangium phytohabitans]MBE1465394.1 hypothetical protein [Kibdelosporangium phytohabitans]